jgi:hypothetical protein
MKGLDLKVFFLLAIQWSHSTKLMAPAYGLAEIEAPGTMLMGQKYYHQCMRKRLGGHLSLGRNNHMRYKENMDPNFLSMV